MLCDTPPGPEDDRPVPAVPEGDLVCQRLCGKGKRCPLLPTAHGRRGLPTGSPATGSVNEEN